MPVQLSKANLKCQAGEDAGTPLYWSYKTEELGQQDLKGLKKHTARMMFREKVNAVITTDYILGNCCDTLRY